MDKFMIALFSSTLVKFPPNSHGHDYQRAFERGARETLCAFVHVWSLSDAGDACTVNATSEVFPVLALRQE